MFVRLFVALSCFGVFICFVLICCHFCFCLFVPSLSFFFFFFFLQAREGYGEDGGK